VKDNPRNEIRLNDLVGHLYSSGTLVRVFKWVAIPNCGVTMSLMFRLIVRKEGFAANNSVLLVPRIS